MLGLIFLFTFMGHEQRDILKSCVVKESDNLLRLEETKTTRSQGALLLERQMKSASAETSKHTFIMISIR